MSTNNTCFYRPQYVTITDMGKLNERGAINVLLIPLILVTLLFIGGAGFGMWAFLSRADYKNNSDKKAAIAAAQAKEEQKVEDAVKYDEEAKKPFDTFIGAAAYGNVTVNYPKNWSAYIIETDRGNNPINGYFHPKFVPSVTNPANAYALRVELVQSSYQSVLDQFKTKITAGQVTTKPYTLAKVPSVVGTRIEGQITQTKQGTLIALPLRNMTLKVWTESADFRGDLDTNILPNLTFVP